MAQITKAASNSNTDKEMLTMAEEELARLHRQVGYLINNSISTNVK